MKKRWLLSLTILLLAVLAACGSDGAEEAKGNGPTLYQAMLHN
ncbi:hypothetical protein [Virgibacillus pantothenticus]|nr:hypothetical protein [Virgibacillus pantothenticus]MEB5452017.1 hypothetical protein [Virgibacillus pantothenticus]MEB5460383.1 hypothetical protein [Virgibacillus pantothenticus]MEB5465470.1 hypothetical protein [Virgibacillus pantothenticus]MEB5469036.1 hypothetical protein [Virgibacillus pantothenticus]MED3735347.1 hypothetical protein [Virgibacillus pantothenticus]